MMVCYSASSCENWISKGTVVYSIFVPGPKDHERDRQHAAATTVNANQVVPGAATHSTAAVLRLALVQVQSQGQPWVSIQ